MKVSNIFALKWWQIALTAVVATPVCLLLTFVPGVFPVALFGFFAFFSFKKMQNASGKAKVGWAVVLVLTIISIFFLIFGLGGYVVYAFFTQ